MTAAISPRGRRDPRVPRVLLPCLLAAGLLPLTGCAALGLEHPATAPHPLPTADASSPAPKAADGGDGSALTDAQARAALLTETDLGAPWSPTRGAATWRDGLLKATTASAECQRLLDVLYTDELLGAPARVAAGLDDADTDAQLRHQIGTRRRADVDAFLAWLRTMPERCARFTAATGRGAAEDVRVSGAPLPEVGDARQGLRLTVATTTPDGAPALLTLDVAAVRVGEDSFALTNGGLGDVPNDATQAAVQIGALRLAEVRRQGRAQV
ncbi:hypothetical protein QQY24_15345 [Streptomyces sp. TG1A-8]|uniref:hypothetical protein n=1 Tax=Streptomyces sp. TG1A-8 TaxID=3051385 RepID=UPI00265C13A8|nr:hypothetical protein [Streptomyces sp. TG1A-8]MDO0926725.1 hypothetical protein [Streptomyces sp. TG1A-8]